MNKRSALALFTFLFATVLLPAQVKKGFKHLEKQRYDAAVICFRKDLEAPDKSIAAGYGLLKAASGATDRKIWMEALGVYDKTLQAYTKADKKAQKKLASEYKITQNAIEQAYNGLFSKILAHVEKSKIPTAIRDSFVDNAPFIPKQYKTRFNKMMIQQKNEPVSTRKKVDLSKISKKKPNYVDRTPPEGSRLEFVKGFNTDGSEYIPVLSADGKTMYFVGSGREDNYAGEDVFYTERKEDGSWSEPKMETFLSGPTNEAVVSLSADGNNLVLFITGKPYISTRTTDGWSEPRSIVLQKTFAWIGMASITRNGEALIFEARPSAISNIDIFIALRKKNGDWDIPFELGSPVNTGSDDRTPFLHSDFKTLYFSSNGHGGQGRFDVFKTTRLDDTWKSWSTPENLGPNVNTPRDEYGFCIPPAGNVAYLATSLSGYSDQDILRIPLDSAAQPEPQVIITGTLMDGSGKTMRGEITVEDADTKKVVQTVATQPDGKYAFSVPKTARVYYYATGDSLLTAKKTFVDVSAYKSEVAEEKVSIVTVREAEKEGKPIELSLFFDFAKHDLRPEGQSELRRIFEEIKAYQWTIEIGGHTDNVGSPESNLALSSRRAQSVRDFLVELGYPAEKITSKGYGQTVPVSDNETEDGRAKNRRVEIKVKK